MDVRRCTPDLADTVASWPLSADECLAWCSRSEVVAADVVEWVTSPDVEAWVLADGDEVVAYGELWVDSDGEEVELARLIVAPTRRASGIGRHVVSELAGRAAAIHDEVVMRVRPGNVAARRCYEAAGFERVSSAEETAWNEGQPAEYVWMRLTRG